MTVFFSFLIYSENVENDFLVSGGKYYYKNGGSSSNTDGELSVSVPPHDDYGEVIFIDKLYLYGTFEFDGKIIADGWGFSSVGLGDLKGRNYIEFEKHIDGFRAYIYNKSDLHNPDNTISTYINDQRWYGWCHYEIVWKPKFVSMYINDNMICNYTKNVPTTPMYVQIHCCNSGAHPHSENKLEAYAKNFKIC
jgi:hypothetical protein